MTTSREKQAAGQHHATSRGTRLLQSLLFGLLFACVGFVYGVLALIYDLTLGDGIGPRLKWYPVVLLAIVVVFALLYFISTLVEESAPPSSPRPRSTQRALEPLSFEPSVLGQMSTRRWQRVHRRVKRRKRLRAVSLLLRLPLAVVIGLLAVLGEATNLDQFLPMDPWIRIPIFGLFALGILGVAVWVVLVAGGDLMSPAVFVVVACSPGSLCAAGQA